MDVIVDTYGSKVFIRNKLIVLKVNDIEKEISPYKIKRIILNKGISITTDVIISCIEHNIDIIFLDSFKNPKARIWNNKFGSISTIRENQIKFFKSNKSLNLAILWQIEKLNKMIENCRDKDFKNEILININKMKKIDISLGYVNVRNLIFSIESISTKLYFSYLKKLIPKEYELKKREKRNSTTKFNSILNYSFGILYNFLERESIIAGLDPSVGILHISNYNKIPFVYDLIEKYRYISFESVIQMLNEQEFLESEFEFIDKKVILGKNVRKNISIYLKNKLKNEENKIKKYLKKISKCLLKEEYEKLYN